MSVSESKDKSFQYSYHNNLGTFKPNTSGINVAQYMSSKGSKPGDAILNRKPVSEPIPRRHPEISIFDSRVESPQNFKYHLKKLHLAVNKILENDRITQNRTSSKKHFKGNQEAYEKMLDAVRNLSSFLQRQTISSSSDYKRISNKMQSCFPTKVRSKSTTYDDSVNRRKNLAGKLGLRLKSVRRTASLTKRPRSPVHYSVFPYSVFDRRHSPCSEQLTNTGGRGKLQRKAIHEFLVTKDVFVNSNETENFHGSQVLTHPEIACLEAELLHRDTLIKYLSDKLLKMHQDNNRIFSEYELQEASLTNHLRLLRSRLTETSYNRDQPCTITNLTTNNNLYTGYIQSPSQHVNYNITDSIVHHFATEISHKLLHSNINADSSSDMDKDKRLQQSLLFELKELGFATQNLLTYWEIKSREISYPLVCQHFFEALLNFFIVSIKSCFGTESNKFMDSNLEELQERAVKSEQHVTELSYEIKNYQTQLDKLNGQFTRSLEEVSIERLKRKQIGTESNLSVNSYFIPLVNFLPRVASFSNIENISTVNNKFIMTDEYQCEISVDTESDCRDHGDALNLISLGTKNIGLAKPTIMPVCVPSRDYSISNLLQRLRVLLSSKESELKGTDLHKSKLWRVHKEEYETLCCVYNILEKFHLNKQSSGSLSSLKSFGLVEPQSSLSTKTYFVPEPVIIGIDKTTSTDELFPVFEAHSATTFDKDATIVTDLSTTTMFSNHHQVKNNLESIGLNSYNREDKREAITVKSSRKEKSCAKYSTKPICFTDTYTPTCGPLTSSICKIYNYQLQAQQLRQMNDQTTPEGDLMKTTLLAKSVLRELQGKFKHLKDSCVQFVSQFKIFNRVICDQLKLVISVFDKYKSIMSSYSFHKYTDVCGSQKPTEPLTDLSLLTDTPCTRMPLGYRNAAKAKYNRSSWSSFEVTPSVAIKHVSPVLNSELSVDNCSSELSQLKLKFEALQSELWKYESEVGILRSNLLDIENHIKLAISNHHFVELQHILDGGERFDVNSLTKAFLGKVATIISHHKRNVVNQSGKIGDKFLCQDIDKESYPLQTSHFLPDGKELIEKRILYSAQQSLLRLTSLHQMLQKETFYKLQYFRRQTDEHCYLVNKEIDKLFEESSDSFSFVDINDEIFLDLDYLFSNILSFSQCSFFCPLFGVHSRSFHYFSQFRDLLNSRSLHSCISCRSTNSSAHTFIGNFCLSCIPFLYVSNFHPSSLKSVPHVIENYGVGECFVTDCTLISDYSNTVCSNNISQRETAFVDSFSSERDYDCILAESERNRLCHLLWTLRFNCSNKFEGNDCDLFAYQHSSTEFMNMWLSFFIDGLFKEILEHLSKSTSSLSVSSLIGCIYRFVTGNYESVIFVKGQNISNLSKRLYEFLNLFTSTHGHLVNDYHVEQKLRAVQSKLEKTQFESELLCFENLCLKKQNFLLSSKDYPTSMSSGDFVASFWKDVKTNTNDSESLTSSSLPIQDECQLIIMKSNMIANYEFDTSTLLFRNSLEQQLCALKHVISVTFNGLSNQVESMIIKMQLIKSKMKDFRHFQQLIDEQKNYSLDNRKCFNRLETELTNFQRRNDEWAINVNSMFDSLSLLMTNHSYKDVTTELSSNCNTSELSTRHYSTNVQHPSEIMLNFDLFIKDFQDQVSKIAVTKNQCDHLSSEVIRLQTSINRQNSQIDIYANVVNNLVAKIFEMSTEILELNVTDDDGNDNKINFERNQCLNENSSRRLNTEIELTMKKIEVCLDQLNSLRLKLKARKQEDKMEERKLEISESEAMKTLDQNNGNADGNTKNVCSTHQYTILNQRNQYIEPVDECINSHLQSTFHYKTLLQKEPTSGQTTSSFTSTTSFLHTKQISGISDSSNLIYPRRAEKTSIDELSGSVDHLRNLHELRSLAKYLLDQYHIVTSELELQSNTNWCLRQRLEKVNSQLNQLTGLLNKNSQALSSIEESLNMTMDESSSYSRNYDGICQKFLCNLRNKHKINGRLLDFTPASDKYSVEYCYAPYLQTIGNKFTSKSEVSSMRSRISDSDHFIINEMFLPVKMMQSVSSQTVKHRNGSCFPSRNFACGPILKRLSGRHHSRRRHQLSSVCAKQSFNNPKQFSHRVNYKESRNTDIAILPIASIRSSEQLDKKNDTNINVFSSHWDKLETGQ
ncbi:hypothetical protein MN116_008837, partial [Schistosoma mekongi]